MAARPIMSMRTSKIHHGSIFEFVIATPRLDDALGKQKDGHKFSFVVDSPPSLLYHSP